VERRENCHIRKLFVSGGVTGARDWQNEIRSAVGVAPETWNPFAGLQMAADALPQRLAGTESRFVAATGAALAALGEP
jgi:Tfp pilus assembly PilM family ATPase